MVARFERWVEGVGRLEDARVVVGVVSVYEEPFAEAVFGTEVDAAGDGQIRVEKRARSERAR